MLLHAPAWELLGPPHLERPLAAGTAGSVGVGRHELAGGLLLPTPQGAHPNSFASLRVAPPSRLRSSFEKRSGGFQGFKI